MHKTVIWEAWWLHFHTPGGHLGTLVGDHWSSRDECPSTPGSLAGAILFALDERRIVFVLILECEARLQARQCSASHRHAGWSGFRAACGRGRRFAPLAAILNKISSAGPGVDAQTPKVLGEHR